MIDDKYPPLSEIDVPTVGTKQCAFYVGRSVATLHGWARREHPPIKPLRSGLQCIRWRVADIKKLLGEI